MKRKLILIGLILIWNSAAWADSVLICHTQNVPAVLEDKLKNTALNSLVEKVMDYFYDQGNIAFDALCDKNNADPTAPKLADLTKRYGADRAFFFQVYWKAGDGDEAVLDRVSYLGVKTDGQILVQGEVKLPLVTPSSEEAQQTEAVGDQLIAAVSKDF